MSRNISNLLEGNMEKRFKGGKSLPKPFGLEILVIQEKRLLQQQMEIAAAAGLCVDPYGHSVEVYYNGDDIPQAKDCITFCLLADGDSVEAIDEHQRRCVIINDQGLARKKRRRSWFAKKLLGEAKAETLHASPA